MFKTIFFSLISISILSGLTAVGISSQPAPLNPEQKQIVNTCLDTWKITVGALAGLVGGRSLQEQDDRPEDEE